MSEPKIIRFKDIARAGDEPLVALKRDDLMEIPQLADAPDVPSPQARWLERYDLSLDGFSDFEMPKPKTKEEEDRLVNGF
ncbi:MAG: (Fe-S)-binding protein, partial [Chloroflexota bacterium]